MFILSAICGFDFLFDKTKSVEFFVESVEVFHTFHKNRAWMARWFPQKRYLLCQNVLSNPNMFSMSCLCRIGRK